LWAILRDYTGSKPECWPTRERLAVDLQVSKTSVSVWLSELCRAGVLERQIRGGHLSTVYRLKLPEATGQLALDFSVEKLADIPENENPAVSLDLQNLEPRVTTSLYPSEPKNKNQEQDPETVRLSSTGEDFHNPAELRDLARGIWTQTESVAVRRSLNEFPAVREQQIPLATVEELVRSRSKSLNLSGFETAAYLARAAKETCPCSNCQPRAPGWFAVVLADRVERHASGKEQFFQPAKHKREPVEQKPETASSPAYFPRPDDLVAAGINIAALAQLKRLPDLRSARAKTQIFDGHHQPEEQFA